MARILLILLIFCNVGLTCGDLVAREVKRLSVSGTGEEAQAVSPASASINASVSADGSLVVFSSESPNLVAADTNGVSDIFLRTYRDQSSIRRISVRATGEQANGASTAPFIAASGDWVVFLSKATNLDGGSGTYDQVFLYSTGQRTVSKVSVNASTEEANGDCSMPTVSSDGRYVAYVSGATNLLPADPSGDQDVYLFDVVSGTTTLMSVNGSGTKGDEGSSTPYLSADGTYLAFNSNATNLVPGDGNGVNDIFIRTIASPASIQRLSVDAAGAEGLGISLFPSLSGDGSYVVFESTARLVPEDDNGVSDIYGRSRTNPASIVLLSSQADGSAASGASEGAHVSPDGSWITFHSFAEDLVPGDSNNVADVFLRPRDDSHRLVRLSVNSQGGQGNGNSLIPAVSNGGQQVVFTSFADNLVANDNNDWPDVFAVRPRMNILYMVVPMLGLGGQP
jgi:Tol biopolymer transport system component